MHLAAERQEYWEKRGTRYLSEVESILRVGDPYFDAQREFLGELERLSWSSILEVGCGFGWHLRAVSERFPGRFAVGIDYSFSQLRESRAYLAGVPRNVCQADGLAMPFSGEQFDVVFTSGMLMYVHPKRLTGAIAEIKRVARRWVIVLEYATEHLDSPKRQRMGRRGGWHAHLYGAALKGEGLRVVREGVFTAFKDTRERVPFSYFIAEHYSTAPPGRSA